MDQFTGPRALRSAYSQSGQLGGQATGLVQVDQGSHDALGPRTRLRISVVAEHKTEAVAERSGVEFRRRRQWRKHRLGRSRARHCAGVALARTGQGGGRDDPKDCGLGYGELKAGDAPSSYFAAAGLAGRYGIGIFARASPAAWMVCAVTIARINPGKRCSSSLHREMLCISTPWRSLRIRPASRRILKRCESVDFGIALSLTVGKFEQLRGHSCATISAYMASRTGRTARGGFPPP